MNILMSERYWKCYFDLKNIEEHIEFCNYFNLISTFKTTDKETSYIKIFYPYFNYDDDLKVIFYKDSYGFSTAFKNHHKELGYKKIDWKVFKRKYKIKNINIYSKYENIGTT